MSNFIKRTLRQNNALHDLLNKRGFTGDDKAEMVFDVTGGRTEHSSEMSVEEANVMIERLGGVPVTMSRRTIQYRRQKAGVKTIVTPEQTGKIERLLQQRNIDGDGYKSLCNGMFKHDEPHTSKEASAIIEALKAMISRDKTFGAFGKKQRAA